MQIGDENLHLVRSVLDEIFGRENFVVVINFVTANAQTGSLLENNCDYMVWYARKNGSDEIPNPVFAKI